MHVLGKLVTLLRDGAAFIPMKVAHWVHKPRMFFGHNSSNRDTEYIQRVYARRNVFLVLQHLNLNDCVWGKSIFGPVMLLVILTVITTTKSLGRGGLITAY